MIGKADCRRGHKNRANKYLYIYQHFLMVSMYVLDRSSPHQRVSRWQMKFGKKKRLTAGRTLLHFSKTPFVVVY